MTIVQPGMRPCGACRAFVASCEHWDPARRPLANKPLPPPSRTPMSLAMLWESVTPRALLAEAIGASDGTVDVARSRVRREAAGRMARRGMFVQLAARSTFYRITGEGRRVHAMLLDMDRGVFHS